MATFGDRLKEVREKKGLSQAELAKYFNLSQSSIAYYEKNKKQPSQSTLTKFSKYFGVTTDYLLGRSAYDNSQIYTILAKIKNGEELSEEETEEIEPVLEANALRTKIEKAEQELLDATKNLTPKQFEAVLNIAKSMNETSAEKDPAVKPDPVEDEVANLPYWHLRLKALREERGLSLEEAAEGIAAIHNNYLTADDLKAYEEGRVEMEPSDQASISLFYGVSWAFMTGRTNARRGDAGSAPVSIEVAHRIDNPMTPLPEEAEKSLNRMKKKRGLYYDKDSE